MESSASEQSKEESDISSIDDEEEIIGEESENETDEEIVEKEEESHNESATMHSSDVSFDLTNSSIASNMKSETTPQCHKCFKSVEDMTAA